MKLGIVEIDDQAAGVKALYDRPYIDKQNVGIYGTSYGGYASAMALLRHPDVFTAAAASSSVTDWRHYDSIYTERYMGLLAENGEGYERSSAMPMADRLAGHLLLVHSAMDENVHSTHTFQLLTALTNAGKDADFRFYPPGAHGAAYDFASYITMMEVYTNTLCEEILPGCEPQDLNADPTRPAS